MSLSKLQQKNLDLLGQKLKKIRMDKGLTLMQLASIIEKDPQSISRVEMGGVNPTYLYLLDVCKGLEIDIKELF